MVHSIQSGVIRSANRGVKTLAERRRLGFLVLGLACVEIPVCSMRYLICLIYLINVLWIGEHG